jgi:hypothetical protein
MEKKIKSELSKMSTIMAVLIALGIYAHDFVLAGLQAKLALNLSIFIIAGLAASLAFRHVLSLRNETVALKALQVDYGSLRRRPLNPYRHPATVFNEPELLGQGYRMITEELSKQGEIKISNATVQVLLHDVDQRINDRKSTILYFSGLMVFLGLLGAFMGLMKTVHSVSELIGGMDLSATAGVDGMARMIDGMKAPLNGMSVGFSSSLFGLMTSMVLGALERCMTSAMKALRNEFEQWLSNLTDLESNGMVGVGGEVHVTVDADFATMRATLAAGNERLERLCNAARHSAGETTQTRATMAELAGSITRLTGNVERLHDPKMLLQPIADVVTELAANQTAMLAHFGSLHDQAQADRSQIAAMLAGVTAALDRSNTLDGKQMHKQLDRLATLMTNKERRVRRAMSVAPAIGGTWSPASGLVGLAIAWRGIVAVIRSFGRSATSIAKEIGHWFDRGPAGRDTDREHARDDVLQDAASRGARLGMEELRRRLNAEETDKTEVSHQEPSAVTKKAGRGERS